MRLARTKRPAHGNSPGQQQHKAIHPSSIIGAYCTQVDNPARTPSDAQASPQLRCGFGGGGLSVDHCGLTGHPTSPRHGPSHCRHSGLSWVVRRGRSPRFVQTRDAGARFCIRSAVCCLLCRWRTTGGLSRWAGTMASVTFGWLPGMCWCWCWYMAVGTVPLSWSPMLLCADEPRDTTPLRASQPIAATRHRVPVE